MALFRPTIIRYERVIDGEKKRCKKGDPGAYPVKCKSAVWCGTYRDANGKLHKASLSENKTRARAMLAELTRKAQLGSVGLVDPFADHRKTPLRNHLDDYKKALAAEENTKEHIDQSIAAITSILKGCKFTFARDISASKVQEYIAGLRRRGRSAVDAALTKEEYTKKEIAKLLGVTPSAIPPMVRRHNLKATGEGKKRRFPKATVQALIEMRREGASTRTKNFYLVVIKAFLNWMVKDRRIEENPLRHLDGGNTKLDRRHQRRALALKELHALIQAAKTSDRVFRGLTGGDRAMVYDLAATTGLRASELAYLAPRHFSLDAEPPLVTLPPEATKNESTAPQPLHPNTVGLLRDYLRDRPADSPLWPGGWVNRTAEMIRQDLEAAGVPYVVDGPEGPLFADFHSLRHTYIALLNRSGVSLKTARQLARHSDINLTAAVYGLDNLNDLGAAVSSLPSLHKKDDPESEQATLKATGTDGAPEFGCTMVAHSFDPDRNGKDTNGTTDPDGDQVDECRNPLILKGFRTDRNGLEGDEKRVDDRIRTGDILSHSQDAIERKALNGKSYDDQGGCGCTMVAPQAEGLLPERGLPDDLAEVVQVWEELPEHVRLAIVALARSATGGAMAASRP